MKTNKLILILTVYLTLFVCWAWAEPVGSGNIAAPKNLRIGSVRIHSFTGLPLNLNGWTDFKAMLQSGYENARVVFVSESNGNDSEGQIYGISDLTFNSEGIFQPARNINAYRTIAAGYTQIRDGYPDILLLKRGDSWNEYFANGSVGEWDKSGTSSTVRIILASYGSTGDRPVLNTGDNAGFLTRTGNNIIVSGIKFYHSNWEQKGTGTGFRITGLSPSNILFEDNVFERNTSFVQGEPQDIGLCVNIFLRRNIFNEGNQGSRSANVFILQTKNILFEENIFSNPKTVEGDITGNRFLYISPGNKGVDSHSTTGVKLVRNIFYNSERTGLSIRSGGEIDNNLIVRNDHFLVGGHGGSGGSIQSAYVRNNVILESSVGPGDGEVGISLINIDGGAITNNILADGTNLGASTAIEITAEEASYVAKNIDISGNIIYDRSGGPTSGNGIRMSTSLTYIENITISNNDIQMPNGSANLVEHLCSFVGVTYSKNRYYSAISDNRWFTPGNDLTGWVSNSRETGVNRTPVTYLDPKRTLKTYNQSLGGTPSTEAFMAEVLLQARHNWRPAYTSAMVNNYIRSGFNKPAVENHF